MLPSGTQAFVAIRAVDDQGNVGRPAVVTTAATRGRRARRRCACRWCPRTGSARRRTRSTGRRSPTRPATRPHSESGTLTVGTPDANGFAANSVASCGSPSGRGSRPRRADEADVGFELSATDVRCAGTSTACPGGLGSDYAGRCWSPPRCGSRTATTTSAGRPGRSPTYRSRSRPAARSATVTARRCPAALRRPPRAPVEAHTCAALTHDARLGAARRS